MIKVVFVFLFGSLVLISSVQAQIETRVLEFKWQEYNTPLTSLSTPHHYLSLNERSLIGVSKTDNKLKMWAVSASAPNALMQSVALSPSGKQVAAVNAACEIFVFDEESTVRRQSYSSGAWGACIGVEIQVLFLSEHELLLRYGHYVKLVDLNAEDQDFDLNKSTYDFGVDNRDSTLFLDPAAGTIMMRHTADNLTCALRILDARSGNLLSEKALSKCAELVGPKLSSSRLLARTFVHSHPDDSVDYVYEYLDLADLQYKMSISIVTDEFESVTPLDAQRFIISGLKSCVLKVFSFSTQANVSEFQVKDGCRAITNVSVDPLSKAVFVSGLFAKTVGNQTSAVARVHRLAIP